MSVLALLPSTSEFMRARVDPGVESDIRVVLRKLNVGVEAALSIVYVAARDGSYALTWAGDTSYWPEYAPDFESSAPSWSTVEDRHRQVHDGVEVRVSVGRDLAPLGLVVLGVRVRDPAALAAVEAAGAKVERLVAKVCAKWIRSQRS